MTPLHFFSGRLRDDPFTVYEAVRAEPGLHRSPVGIWVVARYDDVRSVLLSPSFSSAHWVAEDGTEASAKSGMFAPRRRSHDGRNAADSMRHWALFTDAPKHTRLRRALVPLINARVASSVRPNLARIVDDVLDGVGSHELVDLVPAFASEVPKRVAHHLVGYPDDDAQRVATWATDVALALEPLLDRATTDRVERSICDFTSYVEALVDDRRQHPRDDLVSDLIATQHANGLGDDEVVALVVLTIGAAQTTTASFLATATHQLLSQPEQLARVHASGDWRRANEEALRIDGPAQMTMRRATTDQVVAGQLVRAGEPVLVVLGAANRDATVFPDPDTFRVDREDNRHLGFSAGPHTCPGAALAHAQGEAALPAVFGRFGSTASLAGAPTWEPHMAIRTMHALPTRLGARS
jgi:cytochrome P450